MELVKDDEFDSLSAVTVVMTGTAMNEKSIEVLAENFRNNKERKKEKLLGKYKQEDD
ncbi:hypothetical protein [Fusobacterium sp.]|uniref:hypothetical protein n=1 Tax=Fusobacterium sp. TaxID=68766 RepID=UPI00256EBA96|nr:hypothetical protein [Fusobacterium sp.]